MLCVKTVSYNFCFNDSVICLIIPKKGLRQGDPLSRTSSCFVLKACPMLLRNHLVLEQYMNAKFFHQRQLFYTCCSQTIASCSFKVQLIKLWILRICWITMSDPKARMLTFKSQVCFSVLTWSKTNSLNLWNFGSPQWYFIFEMFRTTFACRQV